MASMRCSTGTEAAMDALDAVLQKALAYPRKGVHVGGGRHVDMPDTWDGNGDAPPGWTKRPALVWVRSAAEAAIPISDSLAAELQSAPAQARLTGPERAILSAALSGRSHVDPEAGGYIPKASAAGERQDAAAQETRK